MDTVQNAVAWLLDLGKHQPDLLCLIVGSLVGYVLTVMLERYFLPIVADDAAKRAQQGLTFLVCWFASGTASAALWWAIDPADSLGVRLTVSFTVSVLSFAVYPTLARWATAKWPAIGSAWDGGGK